MVFAVATVLDSMPNIRNFVERNLGGGADHLIVFLEDADEEALSFLRPHPHVTVIETDASYWGKARPGNLNHRQMVNANTANALLTPFPWATWLFHIDGDEVVDLDRALLETLPENLPVIRLRTLEAISQARWDTDVTHFKRPLERDELALLVALGIISRPHNRAYFRGQVLGKVGIRPRLDHSLLIHAASSSSGDRLPAFTSDLLNILHYESFSLEEFVRKWKSHISGDGPPPRRATDRDQLRRAVEASVRLPNLADAKREKYLEKIYEGRVRDDFGPLLELGLLVERPQRAHRPRELDNELRGLYDQWLAALLGADRRFFHPAIADWPITRAVEDLTLELQQTSIELARLTKACLPSRPRPARAGAAAQRARADADLRAPRADSQSRVQVVPDALLGELMPTGATPPRGRKLVLVTGSGRSGTSTVAGALKLLGLTIPQPEVRANESNPRGFFEPRWAVSFHKRVLADVGVHTLDGRPEAADLVSRAVEDAGLREELAAWLSEHAVGDQVVVKDPRTFWLRELWRAAATDVGFTLGFVMMLRHPAEVVGSREIHYLKTADADRRRVRETGNLAGWVNVTLTIERSTRDDLRCFSPYAGLITDWRATMAGIGERLGLDFTPALEVRPHPVDEFVDADLRRSQLTFDDLHTPDVLKEIAGQVWHAVSLLVQDPFDPSASATLDDARERYDAVYDQARLLVQDHVSASVESARKKAVRRMRGPVAAPTASLPRRVGRHVSARLRRLPRLRAPGQP